VDSVVGIDLSGLTSGARGHTVAAELFLETPLRLGERFIAPRLLRGDRLLVDWIEERRPRVVAIDAPLSLPHSVTCEVVGCERCRPGSASYLARDVDRLAGGMPTVMLAAIAFRGMYLSRQLRAAGFEVIEVYPGAAYALWGLRGAPYEERANFLASRVGGFAWSTRDEVDAVCAAAVATDYMMGADAGVIAGQDGEIILPAGLRPA